MNRSERISIFTNEIWQWYSRHKRELPWRDLSIKEDTQRAYQIMVSEIMLQQTQVERVKIVYKNFLNTFPSVIDLANSSNKEVILAWRGMGYNNRSLRLRDAARCIADRGPADAPVGAMAGKKWKVDKELFPREMDELQSLPGVGHYTAAAIRNFAFNLPTPCIDTNIRRILHRVFVGPENADGTWKKNDQYLLGIAEETLDAALQDSFSVFRFPLSASSWHAALMDFGSLVCTKRSPKWDICPLTKAGIMKAAYKTPNPNPNPNPKREPGRMVGSKYIPNRIFRGKVVDELRDELSGLTSEEIGRRICIDWNAAEHKQWLEEIILALTKDHLIKASGTTFSLAD